MHCTKGKEPTLTWKCTDADVIGKLSARAHRPANLGALAADLSWGTLMAMRRSPGLGDRVPSPRHQIAPGKKLKQKAHR